MIWAVGLSFAAVLVVVSPPAARRLSREAAVGEGRSSVPRAPRRWTPLAAAGSAVAGAVLADWPVGVAAGVVGGCVAWVLQRNSRRRAAMRSRAEVVRSCQLLAGLLRVGLVPASALRSAAAEAPLIAEASAAAELGGAVSEALRRRSEEPGCGGLAEVANAWDLAEATGASMTASLDAVAARLAADADLRQTVAAELSAARATGRLLAMLPLAGLAVGYALGGDPAAFLTGSLTGQVMLILGVGLGCAGVVWTELLAEKNEAT